MHAIIVAAVGDSADRIDWDELYGDAARAYADRGQPADRLADLKARAGEFQREKAYAARQERERREFEEQRAASKREDERQASLSPEEREAERALRMALLRGDSAGAVNAREELARLRGDAIS
jgi:hypothetical protein